MLCVRAFALHEQICKVFGLSVGCSPLPLLGSERTFLLWGFFSRWLFSWSLLPLSCRLSFLEGCRFNFELLPVYVFRFDDFSLRVELKSDHGLDLPDISLNRKELVHQTELHAVVGVGEAA